jgi:hypothetical protein
MPSRERKDVIRKIAAVAFAVCICLAASPLVKGAGGGKTKTFFWVDAVEAGGPYESATVVSDPDLPGTSSGGFTQWPRAPFTPIVITPTGSSVTLLDDSQLTMAMKNGAIRAVQFYIQDIPGPDGIMYETDIIPVDPPVMPDSAGFVLPLRVDNVRVYRDSNHLGGKRIEMVGTVSFGDMVFTPQ